MRILRTMVSELVELSYASQFEANYSNNARIAAGSFLTRIIMNGHELS